MATYHITNATELQNMNNDLNGDYILDNSIDLTVVSWTPVGSSGSPFTGTFDGQGYTLSNLTLTASSSAYAFFGYLKDASVDNLILDNFTLNASITSTTRSQLSILAGYVYSDGAVISNTLSNITLSNSTFIVEKSDSSGGELRQSGCLAGYCEYANITNCNVSGNMSVTFASSASSADIEKVGGLIGDASDCNVSDSWTNIDMALTGANEDDSFFTIVGGFIGDMSSGSLTLSIENCYSLGSITLQRGKIDEVAGFIGYASTGLSYTIDGCYSEADITATNCRNDSCFGGFASTLQGGQLVITDCYSTGDLYFNGYDSYDAVAGFCSHLYANKVSGCYCTGEITFINIDGSVIEEVGGFVGDITLFGDDPYVKNCYCTGDINISGADSSTNSLGGFAFAFYGGASNTDNDYLQRCYCTGNITISGWGCEYIGGFLGEFSGRSSMYITECYSTSNINITETENPALSEVIKGGYVQYVGGFSGYASFYNSFSIYNCYTRSNITITTVTSTSYIEYVAGFISYSYISDTSSIKNSYTSSEILITVANLHPVYGSYEIIGGFFGELYNDDDLVIQNVFSAGAVKITSGATEVGGFIGLLFQSYNDEIGLDNCSWYSSGYDIAIGAYQYYIDPYPTTETIPVTTLEENGWGTDEPDRSLFKNTTEHEVFAQV